MLIIIMEYCEGKQAALSMKIWHFCSWWLEFSYQKTSGEEWEIHWDRDIQLVRAAVPRTRIYTWAKGTASRSQKPECVFDRQQHCQIGRFRDIQGPWKHDNQCYDSRRHPVLHESWGMLEFAIHFQEWCMGPWMRFIWTVHPKACFLCG